MRPKRGSVEWAEAAAARTNARRAAAAPLFAWAGALDEIAPSVTAEDILERTHVYEDQLEDARAKAASNGARYRAMCALHLTPAEIAERDDYRQRVLPASPEYTADYWHKQLKAIWYRELEQGKG